MSESAILAEQLGRARARHDRRPDDAAAYVSLLELSVAYLKALLAEAGEARGAAGREITRLRRQLSGREAALARALAARKAAARPRRRQAETAPGLFEIAASGPDPPG